MATTTKKKDEEIEDLLRIPSDRKLEKIRDILENDEDFRFPRIVLDSKKPKFELPEPTEDEPDNVSLRSTFHGVVVLFRKNFYLSDEDKKAGKEAKEKRALYIFRPGKTWPELFYASPTAVKPWKLFCKEVVTGENAVHHVMCEFGVEHIDNPKTGYKWNKPTFKISRVLTDEEIAYTDELHAMIDAKVKEWEDSSDLDEYEDAALGIAKPKDEDEEEEVLDKGKKRSRELEDEEDEKPKGKTSTKKEEEEDEKPASTRRRTSAKKEEEEEDDKPKGRTSTKKKEEEEEDDKPKSAGRSGYPSLEDED